MIGRRVISLVYHISGLHFCWPWSYICYRYSTASSTTFTALLRRARHSRRYARTQQHRSSTMTIMQYLPLLWVNAAITTAVTSMRLCSHTSASVVFLMSCCTASDTIADTCQGQPVLLHPSAVGITHRSTATHTSHVQGHSMQVTAAWRSRHAWMVNAEQQCFPPC